MSVENKEMLGVAVTWIMRVLSGIGALFLMRIYNSVDENTQTLQDLKQQAATNDVFYRMTLLDHDGKLTRWEKYLIERPKKESD